MTSPAFSRTFSITEPQRQGAGARVVIGDWAAAQYAREAGRRDVLIAPPGEAGRHFDWSILCDCNAIILVYERTDTAALIAQLRSYGVCDIALLDYSAKPPVMVLAPTAPTLAAASKVREEAYG
ncbi:MAG: hypothetical protein ABFE02_11230 [Sulfuricella sp.]